MMMRPLSNRRRVSKPGPEEGILRANPFLPLGNGLNPFIQATLGRGLTSSSCGSERARVPTRPPQRQ
jgi:hypothetical protein